MEKKVLKKVAQELGRKVERKLSSLPLKQKQSELLDLVRKHEPAKPEQGGFGDGYGG